MGVDGLLRQLKDVVEETHLRRFSGQTVVVDALSWLHKACYGCAFELATGKETDAYVRYMLRKVDLLRHCGIEDVVLVFDGQRLPLKATTHAKRSDGKADNRQLALQCIERSKLFHGAAREDEVAKAAQHFQRAVSITPAIISTVKRALQTAKIRFVVAPFEADAQMVWMCKSGHASAIVTEDSDVLVYCMAAGVDAPVLVKLDDGGIAQAVSRSILHDRCARSSNAFHKKLVHLTTGEPEATRMFIQFCALAGCDFLDSLPNMGVVTALKQVFNFRGAPGHLRVQRILSKVASSSVKVPSTFLTQFQQTECIFFHHIIYNEDAQECGFLVDETHKNCQADIFARVRQSFGVTTRLRSLHDIAGTTSTSFLGVVPTRETMQDVYAGEQCPRTSARLSESQERSATSIDDVEDDANHENVFEIVEDEDSIEMLTQSQSSRPRRPEPVIDLVAQEQRKHMRIQQRDASMRSLVTTYSQQGSTVSAKTHSVTTLNVSVALMEQVSSVPSSIHSSSGVVVTPTTVFSIQELASRHSLARAMEKGKPKEPPQLSIRKDTRQSHVKPDSAKKRRLNGVAPHQRTASKSPSVTLLHFFQKKPSS